MKARYSERIAANVPVSITMGSLVWKGRILDLSIVGCLIESTVSVKKGDSLQLRLSLPGLESSFSVALAAVRWTSGSQFGVEFIKMNERDQRQLNQVMARHLSKRALQQEGKRHQFTEPGGPLVPRHLLARRGKSGGCVGGSIQGGGLSAQRRSSNG